MLGIPTDRCPGVPGIPADRCSRMPDNQAIR